MTARRRFLALAPAAIGLAAAGRNQVIESQLIEVTPAVAAVAAANGATRIPLHGPTCPHCLPVLQGPPGLDLYDDTDEAMVSLRKSALDLLVQIRNGELYGVLLPAGWTLKLLGSEAHSALSDPATG